MSKGKKNNFKRIDRGEIITVRIINQAKKGKK